jgi:membrane protease YdiL (CAAX protease family)
VNQTLDGRTVVFGLLIYALLLGASLGAAALWPAVAGVPWVLPDRVPQDVALGLLAGGGVVAASWASVRWTAAGRRLADLLGRTLQGLPAWGSLPLALAAGVAEEAVFRGTLWTATEAAAGPNAAWIVTSVAFGLAHGMFRPGLRTWSAFALATGVLLGGLRLATGGILAAVVAHALVDAVNLPLVRRAGRGTDGRG